MPVKVEQYRPNFFTGFPIERTTVETQKELLSLPFIKNFTDDRNPPFDKFAVLKRGEEWLLFAKSKGGRQAGVAYLSESLGFPEME